MLASQIIRDNSLSIGCCCGCDEAKGIQSLDSKLPLNDGSTGSKPS
jgi:hypothetical protein